jgi:hypothetical protein
MAVVQVLTQVTQRKFVATKILSFDFECEVSCIWQRLLPVVLILLYAHLPRNLETMAKPTK